MSRVCGNRRSGDAVSSLFYNNAVHVWNILYLFVRLMLLSQISVKESTIFINIYMWLIIMHIDICSQRTTGVARPYFLAYTFSVGYRWNIILCRTTVPHFLIHYFYDLYQVSLKILLICFSVFWVFFVLLFLVCLSVWHFPLVGVFPLFPVITWTYTCMYNLSFLWRSIKVKII